jgi:hypothetical protein
VSRLIPSKIGQLNYLKDLCLCTWTWWESFNWIYCVSNTHFAFSFHKWQMKTSWQVTFHLIWVTFLILYWTVAFARFTWCAYYHVSFWKSSPHIIAVSQCVCISQMVSIVGWPGRPFQCRSNQFFVMNLIIVSASNISIDHFIRPVQKAINWAAIHSICLLVGEFTYLLGSNLGLSKCHSQPFWLRISPLVFAYAKSWEDFVSLN